MSSEILGSASNSSGQSGGASSSVSGFSLLPQSIQNAFQQYATTANGLTSDFGNVQSAFTPQPLAAGSQSALTSLENQDYAPTASNVASNVAMQENPYDQSVIDTINRQAQGQNSILGSNLATAGQFGSNRAALGANDIDTTRLQQIGDFKNSEFQTAMQNALTTIPQQQMASASGSVAAGQTQQQQALMQSTAPFTALSAYSSLLGALPQSGGSVSNSAQQSSNSSGTGSGFGMFGMM